MVWDHLSITKPHLVYIILGGFTSLFMLCSSVIKEKMYIGEATVATICGIIFGPHAANLINPMTWGNVDLITIEFSRIVLVVQCFAVGVELPKFYMEKHWKSVFLLLVPVMTWGWMITSLVIWWLIPALNWLDGLLISACITATDPVLASSVVGKGKFAKRVPKHLRDLLSAESGCNDGMAFPFIYLAIYLIVDHMKAKEVTFHWIVYTILYECIFGCIFGFAIGYIARHGIKFAEKRDLIDRESFLVFYFTLALFSAGAGSMLGMDDLLIGFAAGVGFSNDGWFTQKTEESHVSNVIDLLINLAYFVYLGTIIPWEQYNNAAMGLDAWRLVVISLFVLLFRRIPIMLMLKPVIPDVKTWREALFAGHFGPIGVGAIFIAILAKAELMYDTPVPQSDVPDDHIGEYTVTPYIWPIVTFIVIASIIVHGSSIAVFTLGKRINTLTITMSYTAAPGDGPTWMERLPRISSQSRSQARTMSDTDIDDLKSPDFPPGTLPPVGVAGHFLRRQKEEDSKPGSRTSSLVGRRRRKKWDEGVGPGGPISKSAYGPSRRPARDLSEKSPTPSPEESTVAAVVEGAKEKDPEKYGIDISPDGEQGPTEIPQRIEVYDEGDHIIIENQDGDVLAVRPIADDRGDPEDVENQTPKDKAHSIKDKAEDMTEATKDKAEKFDWSVSSFKKKIGDAWEFEVQKRREKEKDSRRHEPARAYQFGNTVS
jgi:sodium/hydrogen antiporter